MPRRPPHLTRFARRLRKRSTPPERLVWRHLRARRMGPKFRRQVPLCGYIVDFACYEKMIVIELDGSQHGTPSGRAADRIRDARLSAAGFQVLRFWNSQVYKDLDAVLEEIYRACLDADSPSRHSSAYRQESGAGNQ